MGIQLIKHTFENKQAYIERVSEVVSRAKRDGVEDWFQDYPVRFEFKEYLDELSRNLPHIRFLPASEKFDDKYRFTRFHAVMDGQLFTLGTVMYEDVALDQNPHPPQFVIKSRKIENGKYNPHRDQYRMVMPALKHAVKQAKKYLLPYTVNELWFYTQDKYKDVRDKFRNTLILELRDLNADLGYSAYNNPSKKILEELKHMKDMGYVPKTSWLSGPLEKIDRVYAVQKQLDEFNPQVTFIRIADAGEHPVVYALTETNGVATAYDNETLPEDIAGRIAVLQTLEEDQYVEYVGYKYDRNTLWLESV